MSPLVLLGLGIAAGLAAAGTRKRNNERSQEALVAYTGVDVGPHCESYVVVDEQQAHLTFLRGFVQSREAGQTDPWVITVDVMRAYNPKCWPAAAPRTPEEQQFFAEIFEDVVDELHVAGTIDDQQYASYLQAIRQWSQGA